MWRRRSCPKVDAQRGEKSSSRIDPNPRENARTFLRHPLSHHVCNTGLRFRMQLGKQARCIASTKWQIRSNRAKCTHAPTRGQCGVDKLKQVNRQAFIAAGRPISMPTPSKGRETARLPRTSPGKTRTTTGKGGTPRVRGPLRFWLTLEACGPSQQTPAPATPG